MTPSKSRRGPTEESRAHAIAQKLVHEHYGDWRYNPGDPEFDGMLRRAKRILKHMRAHEKEWSRVAI